ncbi:MAG: non-ribosomal peptide synthetase [Eubacterium sp.]
MNIQDSFLQLRDSKTLLTCIESDGSVSKTAYGTFVKQAYHVLGGFQSNSIKLGTPIVLQFKKIKNLLIAYWACILGGMVPVIVPLAQDPQSEAYLDAVLELLGDYRIVSDLEGITAQTRYKTMMIRTLEASEPGCIIPGKDQTPGMIQFTSGTTSKPKGAVLTLKNLYEGGIASSIIVRKGITERYLNWLPLSHCFGFVGYHLVPMVNDFPQMQINTGCFIREPKLWLEQIDAFQATVSGLPLFGIEALLKCNFEESFDLSSMYVCFCGGEDINATTLTQLETRLAPYHWKPNTLSPAYGLSETTMGVAYTPVEEPLRVEKIQSGQIRIGQKLLFGDSDEKCTINRVSVGVLDACNQVVIKDLEGRILEDKHLGGIYIRGSNVMQGYYHDETTGIDENGWFDTGDLGFFHHGWLTVFGRYKNIVIINGKNYLVTDLEETGRDTLDGSGDILVIQGKLPDETTNKLVLFGVDVSENTLEKAAKAIADDWKLPIQYGVIIPKIPQTPSGKIDRLALNMALEKGAYQQQKIIFNQKVDGQLSGRYYEMAVLWAKVLDISVNTITMDSHFIFDCGGDSLTMMDLLWQIEKKTGIAFSARNFTEKLTLKKMTNEIQKGI